MLVVGCVLITFTTYLHGEHIIIKSIRVELMAMSLYR